MARDASTSFLIKEGLLHEEPEADGFNEFGEMIRETLAELGHDDISDEEFQEIVENYLAHFGVKGMRWGIRKDRPGEVGRTAKDSKLQPGKPGEGGAMRRSIRGPDGELHALSRDGELVYNAALKLQSGGFGTLSNAEIKAYTDRIKLEDELTKTLTPPTPASPQSTGRPEPKKKGAPRKVVDFIAKTLTNEAAGQSKRVLNIVATNKINSELEKRGVELPNKKKKK